MLKVGRASDEDFTKVEVDKVVGLDEPELDTVEIECELDAPVELLPVDLELVLAAVDFEIAVPDEPPTVGVELEFVVVAVSDVQVMYGSLVSPIACARADCCTSYQEVMVTPARNSSKFTVPE